MDRQNAIRKTLACLALAAPKSGATEAERSTAKEMAAKLMLAHRIRPEEVRAAAPERFRPAPTPPEDVTIVVNMGGMWGGGFRFHFNGSTTTGGW